MFIEQYAAGETPIPEPDKRPGTLATIVIALKWGLFIGIAVGTSFQEYYRRRR